MNKLTLCLATLVSACAFEPVASAQCNDWQQLASLGYAGQTSFTTKRLVEDVSNGTVFLGTDCYCGWLSPAVLRWTGTWWSDTSPVIDAGVLHGIAMLDPGTGPELHIWGEDGGLAPDFFLKRSGTNWIPATTAAPGTPMHPGTVHAAAVFDDGTGPAYYTTRTPAGIFRWNGGAWTSIMPNGAPAVVGMILHVHDDGSGAALYAAGDFTSIDGVPANGIARWNGASWSAVGSGMTSPAAGGMRVGLLRTIQDASGNALYAGGKFELADGQPANGLARWDGTAWTGVGSALPASSQIVGVEWFEDGSGNGPALVVKLDVPLAVLRLDAGVWSPLPALPSNMPLIAGPLGQMRFPGSPGASLVTSVRHPNGYDMTFAAFRGCALTGTLSCVGDGSFGACPCGNDSAPAERAGCQNSLGTGGALRARGDPQLTHDTVVLDGSTMTNSAVLYFQGASHHAAVTFGDGLKCVGGPFVRLATKMNAAGASAFPAGGDATLSVKGLVPGPCTRHYQARYRNPANFCTSDTFNYTNAVTLVWQP